MKILAHGGDTAAEPDVLTFRGVDGLFESALNTVGDEMEGRASGHRDRRSRVVGENEDRGMVGRVVAPPAFPVLVRPRPSDRAEHVAADDPCSNAFEATENEVIVNSGRATVLAVHPMVGLSGKL